MIQTAFITRADEHQQAIQSALRVVFTSQADRLGHVIGLVEKIGDEERFTPLVSSIEGTANDTWPASSPLQSLSIEQRPTGDVALLVGMAGRSHWSASFESFANSTRLRIEHACRVGSEPTWLGSTYRSLIDLRQMQTKVHWSAENLSWDNPLQIPAPKPWNTKPVCWQYELELV